MSEPKSIERSRRELLQSIGLGAAVSVTGLAAFSGSALAWDRQDADFKGCSEVWLILGADDVDYDPPLVVKVVFALPDGSLECREVQITEANTDPIPGQYGDAPIRKVRAGEGEKILGVIFYNYEPTDPFSRPSVIISNDYRCANTPNTPSFDDADCVIEARASTGYDGEESERDQGGRSQQRGGSSRRRR